MPVVPITITLRFSVTTARGVTLPADLITPTVLAAITAEVQSIVQTIATPDPTPANVQVTSTSVG